MHSRSLVGETSEPREETLGLTESGKLQGIPFQAVYHGQGFDSPIACNP